MNSTRFNPRTIILVALIIVFGLLRLSEVFNSDLHLSLSSMGALALFGGAYFTKKWKAIFFPIATLFIGDLILSYTIHKTENHGFLYTGWAWVYAAFALMALVSKVLVKKVNILSVVAGVLACVLIHWIVTDLGLWLEGHMYAKTFGGLMQCLAAAIPFERPFLEGTLLYSAIMFGTFELLQSRYPALKVQTLSIA